MFKKSKINYLAIVAIMTTVATPYLHSISSMKGAILKQLHACLKKEDKPGLIRELFFGKKNNPSDLQTKNIGFGSAEKGIYDAQDPITEIAPDNFQGIKGAIEGSAHYDYTGGMAKKVKEIIKEKSTDNRFDPKEIEEIMENCNLSATEKIAHLTDLLNSKSIEIAIAHEAINDHDNISDAEIVANETTLLHGKDTGTTIFRESLDANGKYHDVKIIKFGGSIITDKSAASGVAREDLIRKIAKEIAAHDGPLIITHGTGSFGHPPYEKYNLAEKFNLKGAIETYQAEKELNTIFLQALEKAGVKIKPMNPALHIVCKNDRIVYMPIKKIQKALDQGYVPVFYGTMVLDLKKGASGLSSDQITTDLAQKLNSKNVGFGSAETGVYDAKGTVITEITRYNYDNVKSAIGESEHTDCTGGMAKKVEEIMEIIDTTFYIFNAGKIENVSAFLNGKDVGTKLVPQPHQDITTDTITDDQKVVNTTAPKPSPSVMGTLANPMIVASNSSTTMALDRGFCVKKNKYIAITPYKIIK